MFRAYGDNPQFIKRLLQDIVFFKEEYDIDAWKTVYIGGGTPSLLAPSDIRSLAAGIYKAQNQPIEEFTIEVNPEDIHPEWLAACREGGIDRLSVGVQSFDDTVLERNGRRGSGKKTQKALDTIKRCWDGTLSCDLIAGLVGQTAQSFSDDVRRLMDYRIDHLSLYGLCSEAPLSAAHEDFIFELLQQNFSLLAAHDYIRYEVSNFSYQDTCRSMHNQLYWKLEPYIGIGPAACGTLVYEDENGAFTAATRFEGIEDVAAWSAAAGRASAYLCDDIDKETFLKEYLMMGFRLSEGIERAAFARRFGADICAYIEKTIGRWEQAGHCRILPERVFLTEEGLFFLNRFLIDALIELDQKDCSN